MWEPDYNQMMYMQYLVISSDMRIGPPIMTYQHAGRLACHINATYDWLGLIFQRNSRLGFELHSDLAYIGSGPRWASIGVLATAAMDAQLSGPFGVFHLDGPINFSSEEDMILARMLYQMERESRLDKDPF